MYRVPGIIYFCVTRLVRLVKSPHSSAVKRRLVWTFDLLLYIGLAYDARAWLEIVRSRVLSATNVERALAVRH